MEEVGGWWTASICEVVNVRDGRFEGDGKIFIYDGSVSGLIFRRTRDSVTHGVPVDSRSGASRACPGVDLNDWGIAQIL